MSDEKSCSTCAHHLPDLKEEPCATCCRTFAKGGAQFTRWTPHAPALEVDAEYVHPGSGRLLHASPVLPPSPSRSEGLSEERLATLERLVGTCVEATAVVRSRMAKGLFGTTAWLTATRDLLAEVRRLRAQLAERHGEHARLLLARDAEISRLGEAIAQGIPDWIPDDVAAATAATRECAPQLAIGLVRARRILDGTPPASPSVETGADPDAKREIVYWDCDDGAESLTWTDPDEAVERYLDDIHPELPEALTVHGYARMAVSADGADPLDRVLEHIDEEHGDPDGDPTTPTPAMRAAEATFLAAVIAEYESWACETVTHQEIDVRAWLQEHDPDRLAEYDAKHGAVEPPAPSLEPESGKNEGKDVTNG